MIINTIAVYIIMSIAYFNVRTEVIECEGVLADDDYAGSPPNTAPCSCSIKY